MQNRDHQGTSQPGSGSTVGSAGANNNKSSQSGLSSQSGASSQSGPSSLSGSPSRSGSGTADARRTKLAQKFCQVHNLSTQQSESAADSFLGSVNWASRQKRDVDFKEFIRPQGTASNSSIFSDWKDEYMNRLRKNGFDDSTTTKLAEEKPDSYFQELSNNGSDENWYSDITGDQGSSSDSDYDSSKSVSKKQSDESSVPA